MLIRIQKNGIIHCWWKCKTVQTTLENSLAVSLSLNLPDDPAVALLGTNPREMQAYVAAGTCTYAFTAALLVTARNQKLFKHPVTGEW